jgi:hypothetical protein
MMFFQLTQKPRESMAGLITMIAGLGVFALSRRFSPRSGAMPPLADKV